MQHAQFHEAQLHKSHTAFHKAPPMSLPHYVTNITIISDFVNFQNDKQELNYTMAIILSGIDKKEV